LPQFEHKTKSSTELNCCPSEGLERASAGIGSITTVPAQTGHLTEWFINQHFLESRIASNRPLNEA